jgi:glycosyltransferase involved in cell wall biosynthesis
VRIAFINQPQDPVEAGDEQRGSVAIVNWELARRLAERHEPVVYAPAARGQAPVQRWGRIEIRRVRFVAKRLHKSVQLLDGRFGRGLYFDSPAYFREYYWQIARSLRRHGADVVHLPQQLQFVHLFRAALPRARIVVHIHQDELAQLEAVRLRAQLERLDGVVTVSDYLTDRARTRFPDLASRIHTIGNGVEVERFRPGAPRAAADGPRRLLFVGRIAPDKGVHLLFEAFERLIREGADLELALVGKPGLLPFGLLRLLLNDDPAATQHLARFYGVSVRDWLQREVLGHHSRYQAELLGQLSPAARARVRFLGTISLQELQIRYQKSDLLVLPSIWHESYGLPVAEAMASGIPVLASRVGGVPELVEDGVTGHLVPAMDPGALTAAMRDLLSDPVRLRRMSIAARARAERLLNWQRSAERLERVYLGVRAQEQPSPPQSAYGPVNP